MLKRGGLLLIIFFSICSIRSLAQTLSSPDQWYNPLQEEVIEYNSNTGSYYFYKLQGGKKTIPYKILTSEEFSKFQQENAMRDEWIAQRNTSNQGTTRGSRSGIIPSLRVESDLFNQIFGGNEISITPQGSVEAIFGVSHTKNDNPMIPSQYRGTTSFDFDTKLQFNISGNIGERLKLNFNYDTEATFDFDQEIKLQYIGNEDDILQKLEAGNVSLPLSGSLITGSQSLFGIKTELKFGKFTFTGLLSQQKSESKEVIIQGGTQSRTFEIAIDEYDANRHFFLSQVFYDNYDKALEQLPLVRSGINITKIEVWVTNRTNQFQDARGVVAFLDLGEPFTLHDNTLSTTPAPNTYPSNSANNLLRTLTNPGGKVDVNQLRNSNNITSYLTSVGYSGGEYYEKLENARKLIQNVDYTLNAVLGYISLNMSLNYDEVLAVAYEYTYNGVAHKVGELSSDGIIAPSTLVVKLLKGTNFSHQLPNWNLMMKNVYSLDAYQVSKDNFMLDIYYEDSQAGTELPYITEGNIANQPLIRALHVDNLNFQNDPYPDGVFDYVEGITVLSSQGKIIFPVREPFGRYLEAKIGNPTIADKYTYKELYDSTLTKARELAEKNKFKLVGSYQSEVASEIYLNASNIPEGSVIVTAGSVRLVENIDYIVNYTMGTVRINQAYLESGTPIKVSMEDRGLFNVMRKTMYGAHLNYEINRDFNIGATILGVHERPLTQKLAYGDDPISNMMWGLNLSYRSESNFLTKMVNKLPFIETKAPSYINIDAEFAQLIPGQSGSARGKTFIDDFDGARTSMDLRSYLAWHLSSTPSTFPESQHSDDLECGFRRSKLAWYSISQDFTRNTSSTPGYIRSNRDYYLGNHFVREIPISEIYPERDIIVGTSEYLTTLNMAYYPMIRGPYNYQASSLKIGSDGKFLNPREQWGGMMRSLTETDFEAANYEYIEFWLMDPFVYNENGRGGDLYINLGNISEDILKDGYKQYENGLPYPFDPDKVHETAWGYVPKTPSVTYAFDNNYEARSLQDVGFDGMNDEFERTKFGNFLTDINSVVTDPEARQALWDDPSSDNYRYYFDDYYTNIQASILDCYANFNGTDGNSSNTGEMSTPNPDAEDLNRDNTMNEVESYYQYRIRITPQYLVVGQNFIEDYKDSERTDKDGGKTVRWYQFKIPIAEYEKAIGGISDFKSIRFMRVYLTDFQDTTYLRFASFDLVRSEWRRYNYSLIEGQEGMAQPETGNSQFDISVVNIEENSKRDPINYVMPPGTVREIDPSTYQENQLNEQSMQLRVLNLGDGEARAAYKSTLFDLRRFRRIQMDVHAESVMGYPGNKDGDVTLFIRMGSDYRNNYYEYEIPLEMSPWNNNEQLSVWPGANFLDLELELLTQLKIERNQYIKNSGSTVGTLFEKTVEGGRKLRILGNPSLGTIRNVMIGIRNPAKVAFTNDDGLDKSVIVWVNELRLTDVDNKGGWAANARVSTTLADFGSISVSGNIKTAGFGSLESRINDRLMNDTYQYDIVTNFELGKFFPDKAGVRIPMFFGFSEYYETPFYNPYDQDVKLKDVLNSFETKRECDSLKRITQTFTTRKSFSLSNVGVMPEGSMPHVFSFSNISASYAFNETYSRNMNTLNNVQKNFSGSLSYNYNVQPKFFQPFKKLKGDAFAFIRDFNIGLYPKRFSFNTEMSRYYSEMQSRNVYAPDIEIPATYAKDFTWNRSYMFTYDIARSLSLTFSATNLARIDEPEGIVNKSRDPNGYKHWKSEVWRSIRNFGRNINYRQDINLTWQVPFNKIKPLNWVSAAFTYTTGYEWVAAPIMPETSTFDQGNTISNMQNIIINGNVNLENLYNKSAFLRSINNKFKGVGPKPDYGYKEIQHQVPRANFFANRKRLVKHSLGTTNVKTTIYDSEGNEVKGGAIRVVDKNNVEVAFTEDVRNARVAIVGQVPKSQNPLAFTGELLLRIGMSVRSVSFTYNEMNTTTLPGFKPGSRFLGQSHQDNDWAPGWGFIFGKQDASFVDKARDRGWLTTDQDFISPFIMTHDKTINARVDIEPIRDFKITLSAFRSYNNTETRYNIVDPHGAMQASGRFSISVISIGSAFENPTAKNGFKSASYDKFLANRPKVAWMFANDRSVRSPLYNAGAGTYPEGYGQYSQQVLVGSFLSAYAGKSINNKLFNDFISFPMPNWDIAYTGLSRIEALKSVIRSATLRHSYTSRYSINSYTLNSTYKEGSDGLSDIINALNDFVPYRDMANIAISESLTPMIQLDLGFQNNLLLEFATNRRRQVALSLANNQITEGRTKEYVIGAGFLFENVPVLFNVERGAGRTNNSTLTLRMNFQYTDELNVIRRLDQTASASTEDSDIFNQMSDGRKIMTLGFRADYRISDKVNMGMFFNRMLTEPYVSAIKTTNTNFGLSVRVLFTD
ncbi:MAG: cell surface protein SprA [Prevotellaceae bacterium]|jgi:cell surface protein SprA|nr:cell surface protein SprA [Prevotellaceae bacterium]